MIRKTSEGALGKALGTGNVVTQGQHRGGCCCPLLRLCQPENRLTQKGILLLIIFS